MLLGNHAGKHTVRVTFLIVDTSFEGMKIAVLAASKASVSDQNKIPFYRGGC